jgi:hypothetical protein
MNKVPRARAPQGLQPARRAEREAGAIAGPQEGWCLRPTGSEPEGSFRQADMPSRTHHHRTSIRTPAGPGRSRGAPQDRWPGKTGEEAGAEMARGRAVAHARRGRKPEGSFHRVDIPSRTHRHRTGPARPPSPRRFLGPPPSLARLPPGCMPTPRARYNRTVKSFSGSWSKRVSRRAASSRDRHGLSPHGRCVMAGVQPSASTTQTRQVHSTDAPAPGDPAMDASIKTRLKQGGAPG